jgi:hypothetical protein
MSPKSRPCRPGGEDGREREQAPAPKQRRDHHRDGVSRPMAGTWPRRGDGEPRRRAGRPAPPSSSGMPVSAGDHEPGQQRVGQRLRAVGQLVEDDPAPNAPPVTPSSATSNSARGPTGSVQGSMRERSISGWWGGTDAMGVIAGDLDDLAA